MNTTDTKQTRLTITEQGDLRISAPDTPTLTLASQQELEEEAMLILGKALAAADGARKTEKSTLVLVDPTTDAKLELTPRGEGGALVEVDLDLLIALLSTARIDIDIDIAIDVDIWPTERVNCARRWRFLLDNKRYISEHPVLTGEDILAFNDFSPSTHQLFEIVRGARRPVAPNEEVSLKRPGIERFIAIKHAVTDGDGGEQAHISWLTEEDREELDRRGLAHASIMDGKTRWLIFEDYPIPEGYDQERVDLALLIPPGYPAAPLDMAYVFPALQRVDGKAIRAIRNQRIGDRTFQRWSRHRDKKGPAWDPEVDGIKTHLLAVDAWMANEVKR